MLGVVAGIAAGVKLTFFVFPLVPLATRLPLDRRARSLLVIFAITAALVYLAIVVLYAGPSFAALGIFFKSLSLFIRSQANTLPPDAWEQVRGYELLAISLLPVVLIALGIVLRERAAFAAALALTLSLLFLAQRPYSFSLIEVHVVASLALAVLVAVIARHTEGPTRHTEGPTLRRLILPSAAVVLLPALLMLIPGRFSAGIDMIQLMRETNQAAAEWRSKLIQPSWTATTSNEYRPISVESAFCKGTRGIFAPEISRYVTSLFRDYHFAPSLASFLALHTNESAEYLQYLIELFMRGAVPHVHPDSSVKNEIAHRLSTEMEAQSNVPSFLHYYLQRRLILDDWPPQAAFVASRYLRRRIDDRFLSWQQRQQHVAELAHEPVSGSELGQAQLLYSQGAGPAFRWRGIPCFKTVYDFAIYTMLMDELRPATIIELGSGAGGSALLFADLCTSLGLSTQIISVDKEAVQELSDPRITFIQSDCASWLETAARSKTELKRPCLLVEDFHGELAGFVGHIDSILKAGDYLVIEDSNPKQSALAQTIAGLPYAVDTKYTDSFGINCTSAINSIFVKQA